MADKGLLVVLSGPSGTGKGTVIRQILEDNQQVRLSISATTRQPREGENHGEHYFFVSRDEFETMIQDNAVLEYAEYCGRYYGTPKAPIDNWRANGDDVILEIEVQGALSLKEKIPELVLVFIVPPSLDELKRRLIGRGTETKEVIENRLEQIRREFESMKLYEYVIENDDLKQCAAEFHGIVQAEHKKLIHQTDLVNRITDEFGGRK
jgi:guanylate kinase